MTVYKNIPFNRILLFPMAVLCLTPWVSAGMALLLGILFAVIFGNPFLTQTRKMTKQLLAISIIGLGAGMNLITVAETGLKGVCYTAIGITLTLLAGLGLGRILKTEKDSSWLITVGTAICGGSAIAAIAPVLHAKHHHISVALGVVFILNALALFLFPAIGHYLDLTQHQFGLWSALAIHDTSSVVGAGLKYGAEALQTGTTVKLARALWIVPLVFLVAAIVKNTPTDHDDNQPAQKKSYPWFILGFLAMAAVVTWVPALHHAGTIIETLSKHLLVLTLFLIGTNLTRETIKSVGIKPMIQGVILWVIVSITTLFAIYTGLIS